MCRFFLSRFLQGQIAKKKLKLNLWSNSYNTSQMSFAIGTSVLLLTDVKGGRVGDECLVTSSKNGWVKVQLVGMDYEMNVRTSQICEKPPVQLSLYDRWRIDAE